MDAYLPVVDTVRPPVSASATDQPWYQLAGTQTIMLYSAPAPERREGVSSTGRDIKTYIILNLPSFQGLHRLRVFKDWKDNWDAEGALAPDPDVVESATTIFGLLALHRVPDVQLSAEGHPMFIYGSPLNGEVVVTGINKIDYFFADDAAPEGEDVETAQEGLPAALTDYIASFN